MNRLLVKIGLLLGLVSTAYSEQELESVKVTGSDNPELLEESGFNVEVISTDEYLNTTKNITQLLNETPGVIVRVNGGLGSNYNLSLNGLGGEQVRYFLDGIPMENFGTSLGLNNIPINLAEKVEVFKGVVPVTLGADALAGAINIVTPKLDQDLLDVSYSYGSFNTHQFALVSQVSTDNGYFLRTSGYVNSSDNNYTVSSVPSTDELGNVTGSISTERFNDEYESKMLSLKLGRINFEWADELSLNFTVGNNKDNQQHPSTSTNIVFGEVYTTNETALLSGLYKKRFDDISIKSYILSGKIKESFYDTASKSYDWTGEYYEKSTPSQGEYGALSIFHMTDTVLRFNTSADIYFDSGSNFSLNISGNQLNRDGEDEIDNVNINFTLPNAVYKTVAGLNYSSVFFNERFRSNVFVKHYDYRAEIGSVEEIDGTLQDNNARSNLSNSGYGVGVNYSLTSLTDMKLSYEKSFRFPEPDEILGSGLYIRANPELNEESSRNYNIGLTSKIINSDYYIRNEINVFYRNAADFISYIPDRVISGIYKNTNRVDITGVEIAFSFDLGSAFNFKVNATYQDLIDLTKYLDNGNLNSGFNERLPNEPYFYGNSQFSYTYITSQYNKLTSSFSSNYVEQYFLNSDDSGSEDTRRDIPEQLSHDVGIEYSFNHGAYNLSINISNITDEDIYDNYNIQKPGRAYYLKLRYVQ